MSEVQRYDCAVCTKKTVQRCSGCKNIYFCSHEHQKLIWPAHKALCGADPESFHLPPLTEQDLRDLEPIKDKPATPLAQLHDYTFLQGVSEVKQMLVAPAPARRPAVEWDDTRDFAILQSRQHLAHWYKSRPDKLALVNSAPQLMNNAFSRFAMAFLMFNPSNVVTDNPEVGPGPVRALKGLNRFLRQLLIFYTLLADVEKRNNEAYAVEMLPLLELAIDRAGQVLDETELEPEVKQAVWKEYIGIYQQFMEG
ncbi:Egl nine 1 [Rhodotorula kratochvilovae]